ncbi:hypothetical protein V8C44DRAFT_325565 [Trichoderma aethiopicum]
MPYVSSSGVSILQPFSLRARVCPHRLICRRRTRTYIRKSLTQGGHKLRGCRSRECHDPWTQHGPRAGLGSMRGLFSSHPLRVSLSRTDTPGHLMYTPHRCMM